MGRPGSTMTKEQPHSVKGTTSHTPSAGGVDNDPTTCRSTSVHAVDTQPPRFADTTGVARPSAGRPPALAVAATLRTCHVVPRTASVREPTQRRGSLPTKRAHSSQVLVNRDRK